MNTKAIADAIAGRFTGVTANGQAIAVGPTASLPNSIAKGPALLVFHPTAALNIQARLRRDQLDFPVRLLTDPLNYPQRSDALYAWADAMRDRVEMQLQLGIAGVASAASTSMRIELDGIEYAGVTFDLVELIVRVSMLEAVTTLGV